MARQCLITNDAGKWAGKFAKIWSDGNSRPRVIVTKKKKIEKPKRVVRLVREAINDSDGIKSFNSFGYECWRRWCPYSCSTGIEFQSKIIYLFHWFVSLSVSDVESIWSPLYVVLSPRYCNLWVNNCAGGISSLIDNNNDEENNHKSTDNFELSTARTLKNRRLDVHGANKRFHLK